MQLDLNQTIRIQITLFTCLQLIKIQNILCYFESIKPHGIMTQHSPPFDDFKITLTLNSNISCTNTNTHNEFLHIRRINILRFQINKHFILLINTI